MYTRRIVSPQMQEECAMGRRQDKGKDVLVHEIVDTERRLDEQEMK